jgi:hypothetical protein
MKIEYIILLVITITGCSCNDLPANKQSCVAVCDKSLERCVMVLGQENRLECHRTYDTVCMPSCTKR